MTIVDPIAEGLASGWKTTDASVLTDNLKLEADVVIVGTGAGGGIAAEELAKAGKRVVLIEEGPLRSSTHFKMDETIAYPDLYQESAARKTKDKAITILQGRCVGGGTTINWTSSFDTPNETLDYWAQRHGVSGASPQEMAPWFEEVRTRLNIHPWEASPNRNNEILKQGCERLGWSYAVMNRNTKGCVNSGYCGMGCPVNAKQGMLVTTIPVALNKGAHLVHRARAVKLQMSGDRVTGLQCVALDGRGAYPTGKEIQVTAKHFVLAAGAIGSPALLKNSNTPDPAGLAGKRTFIHPVLGVSGSFQEPVYPFYGAPQSIYSDEFLWKGGADGPMGYKLEVPPMHPLLSSTVLEGYGRPHTEQMRGLANVHVTIALMRDGFHPESQGGEVVLRNDGTPILDYKLNAYIFEGMRRAMLHMAELQFAAGAERVLPLHRHPAKPYKTWVQAKKEIQQLQLAPLLLRVFTAHVMGGCPMSDDPKSGLVNCEGSHHHLQNLSIFDGSVFPTSIGSNPQVSIYGMALKNVRALLAKM